ncbi:MAG: GNAT family N-acetyltransferase [Coriobacteriales bacterium]
MKKPMPTGNEMPEGFDLVYKEAEITSGLKIDRVSATQLSKLEIVELDLVRETAIEAIREIVGQRGFDFTLERELEIWPEGMNPSDKLIFRAYVDASIVGYTLVVRGWPNRNAWTIQHLIIRPEVKRKGIGTQLLMAVERDALNTTERTDEIFAVPISHSNDGFWTSLGYSDSGKLDIPITRLGTREFECFCKKIR